MAQMNPSLQWKPVDSFVGNFSSPTLLMHRPCPLCGSLESRCILKLDNFQFFQDSLTQPKRVNLEQQQCLVCFTLYLNPCYSDYGFKVLFALAGRSYGATPARPEEQIDWLQQRGLLEPKTRLLDVGCFEGHFLSSLPDHIQKSGLDIDRAAIERARTRFGESIHFVNGDFETFQYPGHPDVITLFHVLEHLPRPVAALSKLRSISHPSTRLVVEVPILEKGLTNDINGFFSVQHMTHFSRQSLKRCLSQSGWEEVDRLEPSEYNGCRVAARPTQPNSAGQPSGQDLDALCQCLATWRKSVSQVARVLQSIEECSHCAIWGAGLHTEFLYQTTLFFQSNRRRRLILIDSDPEKQGLSWRGVPIYSPSVLESIDSARIPLLISAYGDQDVIAQAALKRGVPETAVVKLYSHLRVY
ncbi:MAG: class I SAM-dependent methyltransferase [Acidobacteriota bacterium]